MGSKAINLQSREEFESWILSLDEISSRTYLPVIDDLYSLYVKVRESKSVSILEFGSGWSTAALALALRENAIDFGGDYISTINHPHPFELVTVDASEHFLQISMSRIPEFFKEIKITPLFLAPKLGLHLGQVSSYFPAILDFYPDFIYLDGPDPDQVISDELPYPTFSRLGVPMAADLLRAENLLWPGTILVVDGRGANSRFLQNTFKRNWEYNYESSVDQHNFQLKEVPWGDLVSKHLSFRNNPRFI